MKLVIENYPEGAARRARRGQQSRGPGAGTRRIPFARELYVERDDFMENPPKKFFRLAPGREVRLRYAYFVTCREVVKDAAGEVVELRCTYDPGDARRQCARRPQGAGDAALGRRRRSALPAEIRLYNPLFTRADPGAGGDFFADINPQSLEVLTDCRVEPALAGALAGEAVQFERQGYFCLDSELSAGRSGLQPHRRLA